MLIPVELTREEVLTILGLVKARAAEVERMVAALDEGEGEDLERHRAKRAVAPQQELLSDLTMKLEGAARSAAR